MSVLLQRPHQIPGLINLPRQHSSSSPRRQPLAPSANIRSSQPTVSAPILSPKAARRLRDHRSPAPSPNATPARNNKRRNNNTNVATPVATSAPSAPLSVSFSGNSPATVSASQSLVLSASSTTSIANPPKIPSSNATLATTPPRSRGCAPPKSAPTTPSPANSLPVPANRRRARSPRPTAKLPPVYLGLPIDEDDLDHHPAVRGSPPPAARTRRTNAPAQIATPPVADPPLSPANWQQTTLLKKNTTSHTSGVATTGSLTSAFDLISATPLKGGSASTPTSPATRNTPAYNHLGTYPTNITHSPTMPNFGSVHRRAHAHARAPSVPTFPIMHGGRVSGGLDALFSSAMNLDNSAPSTPNPSSRQNKGQHGRGASVSSSLPHSSSLHARMAAARPQRERTLTNGMTTSPSGGKFAGASFQHAPDAMVLPKPMFAFAAAKFGTSSSEEEEASSSSDDTAVVDLGEDDDDQVVFLL